MKSFITHHTKKDGDVILRGGKQCVWWRVGGEGQAETVIEMPFALVLSLKLYDDCRFQVFL